METKRRTAMSKQTITFENGNTVKISNITGIRLRDAIPSENISLAVIVDLGSGIYEDFNINECQDKEEQLALAAEYSTMWEDYLIYEEIKECLEIKECFETPEPPRKVTFTEAVYIDGKLTGIKGTGTFHQFGTSFLELSGGTANFTTAIIEAEDGTLKSVPVEDVKFT